MKNIYECDRTEVCSSFVLYTQNITQMKFCQTLEPNFVRIFILLKNLIRTEYIRVFVWLGWACLALLFNTAYTIHTHKVSSSLLGHQYGDTCYFVWFGSKISLWGYVKTKPLTTTFGWQWIWKWAKKLLSRRIKACRNFEIGKTSLLYPIVRFVNNINSHKIEASNDDNVLDSLIHKFSNTYATNNDMRGNDGSQQRNRTRECVKTKFLYWIKILSLFFIQFHRDVINWPKLISK